MTHEAKQVLPYNIEKFRNAISQLTEPKDPAANVLITQVSR